MHEILVMFRKDVRRLWWQIGIMLAMSVTVGCLDARRAVVTTGYVEGILNILLPLVWACLFAQAVHAEALVGDREFWMTRPYRWPSLLAAKALFAALFVHVPSFVTDAAILAAHGFSPLHSLPQLLAKQLLMAAALTLPAMMLAAVVSNLTQFVAVGVPILVVSLALVTAQPRFQFEYIRNCAAIAVLAVAAVSIVLLQYWRRWTRLARILAVSTVLAAGLLFALPTLDQTFALSAAALPAASTHAAMELAPPDPRVIHEPFSRRVITELPFTVSGVPDSDFSWMMPVSMEIAGANGVRYEYRPPRADFDLGMGAVQHGHAWLNVGLTRGDYERIKDSKATISGTVGLVIYEPGQEVRLPVDATRDVPGVGHCSSSLEEDRYAAGEVLNVYCESPAGTLEWADILVDEESIPRLWPFASPIGSNSSPSPLVAWLSPLQRRHQSFSGGRRGSAMPNGVLESMGIVIRPQHFAGYATIPFKASDIDLRGYSR